MHHIATIIFTSSPTPSVDDLMDLVTSEFPDAECNEADDGFEIGLDEGTLYVEVEVPDGTAARTIDDDDDDDDDAYEADDDEYGDDDDLEEEEDEDEEDEEGGGGGGVGVADDDDDEDDASDGKVTLMLHFEGEFDDLADVIGVLEVIVASADGTTVIDAEGEPFPLPEH